MRRALPAAIALLSPLIASAEPARIGIGTLVLPQYEGASDYRIFAAPDFAFSLGSVRIESNGPGVQADLFASRAFDAGPILRYDFGRDPGDIDNAQVAALPQIDGSVEIGAFARLNYPIADSTFLSPSIEVVQGLDGGHEGLTAELSVGVTRISGDWVIGGAAFATYADSSYMGAFFGVGAASPSGLGAFSPGAGFKDVGLSAFAAYSLNENWSLVGFASVSELIGDAADSPIVTQTGSSTQGLLGLGVSYTFN